MNEKEQKQAETVPSVGADIGTCNICIARRQSDNSFLVRHHRNMLFEVEDSDETRSMLDSSGFLYVKTAGKCYVVGEDALRLANMIGKGEIMRPMQNGLLNPDLSDSKRLLFCILKAVVGEPLVKGETLRFSVPANPIDRPEIVNNAFHQSVLQQFFDSLGYSSKPINEALASLYNEAPSMDVEGEGTIPLCGMAISFGGGMLNLCLALRGYSVCEFSLTKAGDHIDRQVAAVTNEPIGRVIRIKEKSLDLSLKEQPTETTQALSIYYDEFLNRVFSMASKEIVKRKIRVDGPLTITMCGGTSMVPGFEDKVKTVLQRQELPFVIGGVKMSSNPFYSVVQGCCMSAAADSNRQAKNGQK